MADCSQLSMTLHNAHTHTLHTYREQDLYEDYDALRGGPGVFHS
jgi:hypothetical protein